MDKENSPQESKSEDFFQSDTTSQAEEPKNNTVYIPPVGWRKYIGFGTILFVILSLSALSNGAILAPLIFALGAFWFMPIILRAPLPNGEPSTVGPRFMMWVVIFCVGAFFMPSDPETEAKTAEKPQATESVTPSPTPEPTAVPTPTATASPTPEPAATNIDTSKAETLIQGPIKNWVKASEEDRLIAAGAMTYNVFKEKSKDPNLIAYAAKELKACVDKIAEMDYVQENAVTEWAALCAIQMGWTSDKE